jgi:hydrogenase/urease accessory protein HupE
MVVVWTAVATALLAHNPDTSYVRVQIAADKIETRLTFDVFTLLKIAVLDDNDDGDLSRSELTRHLPEIQKFLREHIGLAISEDDEEADLGEGAGFVWPPGVGEKIAKVDFHSNNGLIHFDFVRRVERTPEEVAIAFGFFKEFGDLHTVLGSFKFGREEYETIFTRFEPDFSYVTGVVYPTEDAGQPPRETPQPTRQSMGRLISRFFKMGVEHIFLGYDHICFLIALIVVSKFREIVKIVTSFTIAHSITLILATLDVVRLPTRLIETCIAATVVYVAVENLWIKDTRHRWWLTFFFGLFHGFGFANVLREMGLPKIGLIRCLLSFNVGVEVGQLAIALCLLPLAYALNHWKHGRKVAITISILLALFGAAWFIDRAFALEFMQRFGL